MSTNKQLTQTEIPPNKKQKLCTNEVNDQCAMNLYKNPACSDVTLVVAGKEFPVMRSILSELSAFLKAIFDSTEEEAKENRITLKGVDLENFELLLKFMYSGKISVESTDTKKLVDLLSLAHFFGLHGAMEIISDYMEKLPRDDNGRNVAFFNVAVLFDLEKLLNTLMDFILLNSETYIKSEIFNTFYEAAILKLLDNDHWAVDEATIVLAVAEWLNKNSTTNQQMILQKLRLTLIPPKILAIDVRKTQLFTDCEILDAIARKEDGTIEPYRYHPKIHNTNFNVKTNRCGCKIIFPSKIIGRIELFNELFNPPVEIYQLRIGGKSDDLYLPCIYHNKCMVITFPPLKTNQVTVLWSYGRYKNLHKCIRIY